MKAELILDGTEHIMFGWSFHGGCRDTTTPEEVVVSSITSLFHDGKLVMVHFLDGYKSIGEQMTLDKIIAIGDNKNGTVEVKGWGGKYRIVNQELFDKYLSDGILELK